MTEIGKRNDNLYYLLDLIDEEVNNKNCCQSGIEELGFRVIEKLSLFVLSEKVRTR